MKIDLGEKVKDMGADMPSMGAAVESDNEEGEDKVHYPSLYIDGDKLNDYAVGTKVMLHGVIETKRMTESLDDDKEDSSLGGGDSVQISIKTCEPMEEKETTTSKDRSQDDESYLEKNLPGGDSSDEEDDNEED
jgi:hypothetical protein